MVITAIERQKRSSNRVSIFIDGEFALGLHEDVFAKCALRKGDSIDERSLKNLQIEEEFNVAKVKALRLIGYRLRSEQELRRRLKEKEILPEIIDKAIHHLRGLSLVDDRAFAKAFVHDLILKKSAGRSLIQRELRQKGIATDIINETIHEMVASDDEQELAYKAASVLLKRYKTSRKRTDSKKQQQRITAFLMRKGFDFSIITVVTKKLFSNQTLAETDEP